eukprot:7161586-Pyramimonas_sp.AAC.1
MSRANAGQHLLHGERAQAGGRHRPPWTPRGRFLFHLSSFSPLPPRRPPTPRFHFALRLLLILSLSSSSTPRSPRSSFSS